MHIRSHTRTAPQLVVAHADRAGCVTSAELREARRAVDALPAADRALLRAHRLKVELIPKASLEDSMLGATKVVRGADDKLVPLRIRVASKVHGVGRESLREIVQHEVGHAISVLRKQDPTEDAAIAYAKRHS